MAGSVQHLDLDAIAELQKWRLRLTLQQGLHRAQLGQTRVANAAELDRLGWLPCALVGDRAGADNAAGAERARPGRVGNELGKRKCHIHAGIGPADELAVEEG